jgi:phosphoglycerate dehydrogenase-like enzyme
MEIVIPDDYPPAYASLDQPDLVRLKPYGTVTLHTSRAADRPELFARLEPAEVVVNVRAYTALDDEALSLAPRLRLISILGTGTDNVDLTAATRRGITVTNTPGVGAPSVAELTLGLIVALARAIPLSDARLRQGTWQHIEGPELAGKTLGLLGLGAIGSYVARLGQAIGMRVIAWSFAHDDARAERLGVELVGERDDIFRRADVVSLHLRNTPEVHGLVGARELLLMKPTAYIVNTARGALVDAVALADALREHRIAGAALDVFTEEPMPPERNAFRELDNVILTPHIGAVTREANARSRAMPVDNIIAFLEGRPEHVVNR